MTLVPGLIESTTEERSEDPKKWYWPLALIVPTLPSTGLFLYDATGWWIFMFFAPIVIFVWIPIQDLLMGVDTSNLDADAEDDARDDGYYRWLVVAYVPLQYAGFAHAVWWLANNDPSLIEFLGLSISVGNVAGIAINNAHEMGHKSRGFLQWTARVALAQSFYGHFFVEHNRGHHRNVATPVDPASSRFGESLWAFLPRTVVMSVVSAWRLEAGRLRRNGLSVWHWSNKNLQSWAMTIVLFGAAIAYAGPSIIPFLVVQAVVGLVLLEVVNYLEHYGLLRQRLENGNYERCQPHHSWNSNNRVTNVFLYHLQRHSDHHANATRPYQVLRNMDGAPNLPFGYATMIPLALVPPLWFRVMNPRVLELYEGDITRTNLSPRLRRRLERTGSVGAIAGVSG